MVLNDFFVELTYGKTVGCIVYLDSYTMGVPYIIWFSLLFATDRFSISFLVYEWLHFQNFYLWFFFYTLKIILTRWHFHCINQDKVALRCPDFFCVTLDVFTRYSSSHNGALNHCFKIYYIFPIIFYCYEIVVVQVIMV